MKRNIVFLLGLMMCVFSAAAFAEDVPEFSADTFMQSQGRTIESKIFISHDKIRTETMGQIMIIRKDLGVMWMMMPQQSMYMEQPMDPNAAARASRTMPGETERVPMGKEDIDGKPADKFKVTYNAGQGATTAFQWIGARGVPVRMQSENGEWTIDYKNIQFGSQDASLFELPAGYQKMEMPDMSQLMAGQQGQ